MAWKEIVDYTVPSNTTSVDITGLNITKDDFIKITANISNPTVAKEIFFSFNGLPKTNFYRQHLQGFGTSVSSERWNDNSWGPVSTNSVGQYFAYLKISENNKSNVFSNNNWDTVLTSTLVRYSYVTSTANISSITSLNIFADDTNGIGANSRIQIYKLEAEKVADITATSNIQQFDILDLDFKKGNEYLLIADYPNASSGNYYRVFPNDLSNNSDYYVQRLLAVNTTVQSNRINFNAHMNASTGHYALSYVFLKISNTGAFTFQAYGLRNNLIDSLVIQNDFLSSIYENLSDINKLTIQSADLNEMLAGSRVQLYKLY